MGVELAGIVVDGVEDLLRLSPRRVVIEAPVGIRSAALTLAKVLEEHGSYVIVEGKNVWGSCDISKPPKGFDVVHLGHALPPNVAWVLSINGYSLKLEGSIATISAEGYRVYVLPAYYKPISDVVHRLSEIISSIDKPILAYPLLYKLYAEAIAGELGLKAYGPFTGCFMPLKAGKIVVVSGGYFYGLTAKLMNPDARVFVADPHRVTLEDVEHVYRKYLGLKMRSLLEALNARRLAIVVSSKPGQGNLSFAMRIQDKLIKSGREAYVVYVDEVTPEILNNIDADAVIIDACPRIALDDLDRVSKPLIAPMEVDLVIRGNLSGYRPTFSTILPMY